MKQKTWLKIVRLVLLNAKWVMFGILLLNLFAFGYWDKINTSGLDDEEIFWGAVIVIALILFAVFDKKWKGVVNKICDSI